jgi:tripartite-type tricarboxylate transporter receptor subunit TctC
MNSDLQITRRRALADVAVAATWTAGAAAMLGTERVLAQEAAYPNKPATIIVGFPPGTATDVLARLLVDYFGRRFGQSFIVDNRAGMGGAIGAAAVARARPDGYTLLIGATAPISINPHIYANISYKPLTDFAPIGPLAWVPLMLVAPPSLPANDLQQLLEMARQQPSRITFASTGNGTTSHLLMAMLASRAKVQMTHVPYKGSAQAQTDMMATLVSCSFDTLASALPLVRAGKLKALAVSSLERAQAAPNVPTVAEQGFPGFDVVAWTGMLAPAGTPVAVLDRLAAALDMLHKDPEFVAKVTQAGNEIHGGMSREQFTAFIRNDYDRWGKVVREFDVTVS